MPLREPDLLGSRSASFANVIPGDRNRVPGRQHTAAIVEGIDDQPHRRFRREDVGASRRVLLKDVVLDGAAQLGRIGSPLLRHDLVEQEQERCGGVDGHRRGNGCLIDAIEEDAHVIQGRDRHTGATNLTQGARIVGIEPELRRQIEGHAEPRLPA
jgi:hypothetical protein